MGIVIHTNMGRAPMAAEVALVVNNDAAAVLLALSTVVTGGG